jgi:hypothetical protein
MGRLVFGTDAIWDLRRERPALEVRSFRDYKVYAKNAEEKLAGHRFFLPMLKRIIQRMAQLD